MMITIGITGGVGAGKSTVLDFLEEKYQAYVMKADEIGHLVMEPGLRFSEKDQPKGCGIRMGCGSVFFSGTHLWI